LDFLAQYGLFLAKTLTIAAVLVLLILLIAANSARHRHEAKTKGNIVVSKLNDEIDDLKEDIRHEILDEEVLKAEAKADKKKKKEEAKAKKAQAEPEADAGKRIFVLDFDGDTRASAVEDLRQCITAILTLARPGTDEVMLCLESPGGMVHAYGLAASQLVRLRKHGVQLTICVDRVAASGGYMMACVANQLIAAPFAYIGSIGVLVQLPNVHRLLKDNKVDFEMVTAGEYKRTLTTFGENTDRDRAKVQEEVDEMHELFKQFIHENRPGMDMAAIATGEVWTGTQALQRGLIDAIDTSDEWITGKCADASVYRVSWEERKPLKERISSLFEGSVSAALDRTLSRWLHRADKEKYYS
jgi:serine protease SohB